MAKGSTPNFGLVRGFNLDNERLMLENKLKMLNDFCIKYKIDPLVLSQAEECRALQYECECREAAIIESGISAELTVEHLLKSGFSSREWFNWLKGNILEHDRLLRTQDLAHISTWDGVYYYNEPLNPIHEDHIYGRKSVDQTYQDQLLITDSNNAVKNDPVDAHMHYGPKIDELLKNIGALNLLASECKRLRQETIEMIYDSSYSLRKESDLRSFGKDINKQIEQTLADPRDPICLATALDLVRPLIASSIPHEPAAPRQDSLNNSPREGRARKNGTGESESTLASHVLAPHLDFFEEYTATPSVRASSLTDLKLPRRFLSSSYDTYGQKNGADFMPSTVLKSHDIVGNNPEQTWQAALYTQRAEQKDSFGSLVTRSDHNGIFLEPPAFGRDGRGMPPELDKLSSVIMSLETPAVWMRDSRRYVAKRFLESTSVTSEDESTIFSPSHNAQPVTGGVGAEPPRKRRKHPAKFMCPYPTCKRLFTRHANLQAHLRAHVNERPFQCPKCDKAFARSEDCSRHFKERHDAKSLKHHVCYRFGLDGPEGCGQTFTRAEALRRHLRLKGGACRRPADDAVSDGGAHSSGDGQSDTTMHAADEEESNGRPRSVGNTFAERPHSNANIPKF